ncbi:formylglycine-generating enzyme family protein [Sorangium sp. So ce1024]|uniref:formylglycine-generating enzyme family protein n=1 Tax=unclassified Sorangium TaxID=2621164 RepID=UPI003F06C074
MVASAGCAPGSTTAEQITPRLMMHASLDARAAVLVERPMKAKELETAAVKDGAALEPAMAPESGADQVLSSTGSARCPAEMALVEDRVCVDRWESSLVELTPSGERRWSPFEPVDGNERRVRAVSWPGVIPQGYISGRQAKMACAASGKRLCTSDEWVSACRGPEGTTFPYGAQRQHGACNDDERPVHPVAEIASLLDIKSEELWTTAMNNPLINQLSNALLPTGERAACTNGYGVYDMVGNLHEWVDDPNGTFRGGYFMDTTRNGEGCKYATTAHSFGYHDYSTGFRCCMDPEQVD